MKAGKLPQAVLERSVLRYVKKENKNEQPPAVGFDAGVFLVKEERMAAMTQTVSGEGVRTGELALLRAVNSLAVAGAVPEQVTFAITLPVSMEESELKKMMERVQKRCKELSVTVAAGHTAVSKSVTEPVVSVTALGSMVLESDSEMLVHTAKQTVAGAKIIMTKWCGLCGTALLAEHYKEALCTRYTKSFIEKAEPFFEKISVLKEVELAKEAGVLFMHAAAEGGIFGALWELAEQIGCGMDIDIRKIPIKQETVEICEYFDCNPYQLRAEGSLLLVSKQAEQLCLALQNVGIPAAVIGEVKEGNDRRLLNEDEVRFLEPNRVEEYERIRESFNRIK